jgi:hypothetical protein
MNYQAIYNQIVTRAKLQLRTKLPKTDANYIYYEAHHIIPKCLGGTGKCNQWKWHHNIVLLSPKEHFICHLLLTEIYPNNPGIISSAWLMCNSTYSKSGQFKYRPSSKTYERLRLKKSLSIVKNETRKKQSEAQKGNKNGSGNKGQKRGVCREETRIKISMANKGRVHSEQSRLNMSLAHIGKTGKRKILCCPHCKKEGGANGMRRYHFDNCKILDK